MCGIAGILHFDREKTVDPGLLRNMERSLIHRGPDDAGIWHEANVGLAHRRLSILDLSERGHQPFHTADGRFVITYNGEIYNFAEFRQELLAKGYALHSSSDTEILLYLYAEYGPKMLHRLNGMFAFAIWDKLKQELFLCRDRMGVKPLYYAIDGNSLYFASEQKALFSAGVPLEVDESHWDEFLLYRYVAGAGTLFRGVCRLLPGHYAVCREGRLSTKRWWNLGERKQQLEAIRNPVEWFDHTFQDSVRYRMVSDVPVGVLLSGGLDSSSILASLYRQSIAVSNFNIGFEDQRHDESALAKLFSEQIGYPFYTKRLEGEDLYSTLEDSSWYLDEPLVHHNDPHLLTIARLAKHHVSVLISGEGSDELMSGYVRYRTMRYQKLFPLLRLLLPYIGNRLSPRFQKLARYIRAGNLREMQMLNASNLYPLDFAALGMEPQCSSASSYRAKILNEASVVYPGQPLRQLLYLDQHTYLCSLMDRNDRSTMGAGIECREPFLDYRLVEGLATLPIGWLDKGRRGKYILLKAMKSWLPMEIVQHRKIGLSVPWTNYLISEPAFSERLDEMEHCPVFHSGILQSLHIRKLVSDFRKQPEQFGAVMGQMFMIYIWYQIYFKRIGQLNTQPVV